MRHVLRVDAVDLDDLYRIHKSSLEDLGSDLNPILANLSRIQL